MAYQGDIDFKQIVPRLGGQREAFEELCCQLAHRTISETVAYRRLHGAGGDGGVECFADMPDGTRLGWQAKYVFDIGSLLSQATRSLTTALSIHPNLSRYVVCFPFDLTGPTARRGRSGQEKFDDWRKERELAVAKAGRHLTIEAWPAFRLRDLLLAHDSSGGMRGFFFNQRVLTHDWFAEHLDMMRRTAGPRYTPQLNVETGLWKWFAAFGRTTAWANEYRSRIGACRKAHDHLASAIRRTNSDAVSPAWPDHSREEAQLLAADMAPLLDECERLVTVDDSDVYRAYVGRLGDLLARLKSLESTLAADFNAKHGAGKADSPGFRQYMAEYMASFPAANLDRTREAIEALTNFRDWLLSPASSLAYERVFVLSGVAGSGKTHGVCDAADSRLSEGLLTCVAFGHHFGGEPHPWSRLLETFGLPATLGMNGLLDALNAAGEASGSPLVLFIDAINETRPLRYWHDWLSSISQVVERGPFVRLCVTCRTSFVSCCLPDGHGLPVVEHAGFAGREHDACSAFFQYYGLEPPILPILQPELSNPLYLRLVCEALLSSGLHRLPAGWRALAPTIRAFLEARERQFSEEHGTSTGAKIATGSLMAIARAIADSGESVISWSSALRVVSAAKPQASTLPVLEWLVRADLLLEDAPVPGASFDQESVVRPAFERLGDFLVASELMKRCEQTGFDAARQPDGALHALLKDSDALARNGGVLGALSILLPEQYAELELPSLADDESVRDALVRIAVRSFPSRDPGTFTAASESLLREALGWRGFSYEAMDALLSVSWQPSAIDAAWLDRLLKRKLLAQRDAYWCPYLHDRFESRSTVHRLIYAAFDLPLEQLDPQIAERWSTVLLWFTAAADRRVKDWATRAATAILTAEPEILLTVLQRLITCDDDKVRERALLSCYGALIVSRHTDVIRSVTEMLHETYRSEPEAFDNALIRDHIRCIGALAQELGALPEGCDPDLTMQPIASAWPLKLPSEDQVEVWGDLLRFRPDEFLSDFFKYSMNCLRPWEHAVPKRNMGEWILQRAARDLGYEGSGCERYDDYMLGNYGGGRGRPTWAERIGKKYQWVGMYQLASRLHDHSERGRDSWEPEPLIEPLILLEERKQDPTLPHTIVEENERSAEAWWIASSVDPGPADPLADPRWVARQDDTPALEQLLSPVQRHGQRWRVLVSYPVWGRRDEEAQWNSAYRQVWVHVESYLVLKKEAAFAYDRLQQRNFFGRWMPEGATWLYGFAGEYPWGIPFNTEPEEKHGDDLAVTYVPCWNRLAAEWEYDASVSSNRTIIVPARAFFSPADLWWDGRDGYGLVNGGTVLRDPSVIERGPASLIADEDDLLERLDKLGLQLIWTLLGEKWILGGPHDEQTPRRTFSQSALLNEDGSVHFGQRVFFGDYDRDTGLKDG